MDDFEKLGVFYVGRPDEGDAEPAAGPLLYDSRDLVTHAVCVGMTGSGKTGLCIGLVEEALLDGVPVIAIDPKGDLSNLLLTFPQLAPTDFEPWVNEGDAERAGLSVADFAAQQAETWTKGLADWGQDGARIQKLRDAADFAIYTPGSSSGLPVSILSTLAAPAATDEEALADRASTATTSILSLLGIDADPIRSREHILLTTILHDAWKAGRDLTLADLIAQVQDPPIEKVGVMELNAFFKKKDRQELALAMNNLLAAPGFATWLTGTPLDIGTLLHSDNSKPRCAIFSIAHLGDAERMFFVSLLLNETLAWMRAQSGTTSLRAMLYMDEIFGFFPPVAEPPSKRPLLTLLKQARAFGLGVVLATQNPVDLDYKGLANTGTWFIGRMQTDNDKQRVLDGLEGVAGGKVDKATFDKMISGLEKRRFLLHNVHEDEPVVFQTRWALSYLRGPLTLPQIKTLVDPIRAAADAEAAAAVAAAGSGGTPVTTQLPDAPATASASGQPAPSASSGAPSTEVDRFFVPATLGSPPGAALVYAPMLLGIADVDYGDTNARIAALVGVTPNPLPVDWAQAQRSNLGPDVLQHDPSIGAEFLAVPEAAQQPSSYKTWTADFKSWITRTQTTAVWKSPSMGTVSAPGESERDFRVRLAQSRREGRDDDVDKMRTKFADRLHRLEERRRKAEQAVEREADQAKQAKMQTGISVATTVLGSLLGRKRVSAGTLGRATTAVRGAGRAAQQQEDVARARENVAAIDAEIADLQREAEDAVGRLGAASDPLTEPLEAITVAPKSTGVDVQMLALTFCPFYRDRAGGYTPAWR